MSIFSDFGNWAKGAWNDIKEGVSNAWNSITDWFDDTFTPPGDTVFEEVAWNNKPTAWDSIHSAEVKDPFDPDFVPVGGVGNSIGADFIHSVPKEIKNENKTPIEKNKEYETPIEHNKSSDFFDDVVDKEPASEDTVISDLEKAYQREDEIRKHVEEREDTAYQRAVADMKAAGINPELLGVTPAVSGGGITSASRKDYSVYTAKMQAQYSLLEQEIQNNFQGDQNKKDRIMDLVKSLISGASILFGAKSMKK